MTIGELLRQENSTYVARRLLSHVFVVSQEHLILLFDSEVSETDYRLYIELRERYVLDGEPLAYILGYELFCGQRFFVNNATLIPRPESEYLVCVLKEYLDNQFDVAEKKVLVDVGTGSGCIGISIMQSFGSGFDECFLLDISKQALNVAKQNVQAILPLDDQEKVRCVESDLLASLCRDDLGSLYVVANLPYIPEDSLCLESDVQKREPQSALYSGSDGLEHYRRLLVEVSSFPNIQLVLMEMMREQYTKIRDWGCALGICGQWSVRQTFHENIVIVSLSFPGCDTFGDCK